MDKRLGTSKAYPCGHPRTDENTLIQRRCKECAYEYHKRNNAKFYERNKNLRAERARNKPKPTQEQFISQLLGIPPEEVVRMVKETSLAKDKP